MGPDRPRPRMPIRIRQNDSNQTGSVKSTTLCKLGYTRRKDPCMMQSDSNNSSEATFCWDARKSRDDTNSQDASSSEVACNSQDVSNTKGLRSVNEAESTHNRWSCILCAWRSWRCCLSNAVENYSFTKRSIFWSNWRKILHRVCNTACIWSDVIR